MKKVINIFLFILCFTVISCHDDDAVIPALSIIKADTNLKATGGEASVQIQAIGEVKATTDVEWCKVTEVTTDVYKRQAILGEVLIPGFIREKTPTCNLTATLYSPKWT